MRRFWSAFWDIKLVILTPGTACERQQQISQYQSHKCTELQPAASYHTVASVHQRNSQGNIVEVNWFGFIE
jgi:hypothetical protein